MVDVQTRKELREWLITYNISVKNVDGNNLPVCPKCNKNKAIQQWILLKRKGVGIADILNEIASMKREEEEEEEKKRKQAEEEKKTQIHGILVNRGYDYSRYFSDDDELDNSSYDDDYSF